MAAKLIIVEGLPGAGKSTTAQKVCDILNFKGIDTELYSEGNFNHPADFDGVAYFNSEEFNILERAHSESNDVLNKVKFKYLNGYLIPYRKAVEEQQITFENELFKDITISYINNLANIIMPLEPLLIYIEQASIKESFMKAVSERPKEWIDGFTDYYTNQGYGLYNNLKGIEGVIEVLKARNNFEKEIYDSLNLTKYKIDNSEFNLELLEERINLIVERNF